ncbi:MAG: hypothetical protein IPQ07_40635 [Myxococcales bacterium]|nr:hypothetical protein [Myxococcales bacterium]
MQLGEREQRARQPRLAIRAKRLEHADRQLHLGLGLVPAAEPRECSRGVEPCAGDPACTWSLGGLDDLSRG